MFRTQSNLLIVVTLLAAPLATAAEVEPEAVLKPINLPKSPLQTELIEPLNKAIADAGNEAGADLFKKRGRQFAYGGNWEKAAADFRRAAEIGNDANTWMLAGVTFLLAGDRMSYEKLVDDFLKMHADRDNPYSREKRAKMCVLPREPVAEEAAVRKLIDQATSEISARGGSKWEHYFWATAALTYYRYGDYKAAHRMVVKADKVNALKDKPSQDVYAICRLIEAMSFAKQGDAERARTSFHKADNVLRERLRTTDLALKSDFWHDWMIAKLLHDEACRILVND